MCSFVASRLGLIYYEQYFSRRILSDSSIHVNVITVNRVQVFIRTYRYCAQKAHFLKFSCYPQHPETLATEDQNSRSFYSSCLESWLRLAENRPILCVGITGYARPWNNVSFAVLLSKLFRNGKRALYHCNLPCVSECRCTAKFKRHIDYRFYSIETLKSRCLDIMRAPCTMYIYREL